MKMHFVISICLFVCPIITQEPLDRFGLHFNRRTIGRTKVMIIAWFKISTFRRGWLLQGKLSF